MENPAATALYNDLVTKDLEPETKDANADPVDNPAMAEMFVFDWKTQNKNYGTVVILFGAKKDFTMFFGDNLGRTMEQDDKQAWYNFLEQMKHFAMGNNFKTFNLDNINRLKYSMQGMAAIKEGLFEGYYGKKNISYSDQPKQVRLMIKHNRNILEGEPRYRAIESLFVETADGERFKVPTRSLTHGRMIARHCAEGGTPYDAFGNHINEIINEIATLSRFIRASKHKPFTGAAAELIETAVRHYSDLKAKAKQMISQRGYHEARESFDPAEIANSSEVVESIRNMFIEQTLDSRIEEALPILAKLKETPMREADEFESWTDQVLEGTWAFPDDSDTERQLKDLMSKPLIVGTDATNATEQLYDLVGDDQLFDILHNIADEEGGPDSNAWDNPLVINRLGELGIDINPTVGPDSGEQDMSEAHQIPGKDEHYTLRNNIWTVYDGDEIVHEYTPERGEVVGAKKLLARFDDEGYDVTHVVSPMGVVTYLYGKPEEDMDEGVAEGMEDSSVASALTRRIMSQRLDLLKKYGPVKVTQAIDSAAEFFGDVEEIGSSDMHAYMQYVEKELAGIGDQGLAEGTRQGIMLNGKEVDMRSLEIENVDSRDYPDFSDAYIGRASFTDGTDLSDQEMDQLNDEHGDLVHELAYDSLHESDLGEDLDTDGVMMTKPSNMSSESVDPVLRLKQMLKY